MEVQSRGPCKVVVALVSSMYSWNLINTHKPLRRNSHQVPRHHLEKMLDRYEHNVTVESILASNQPERKESQTQRERYSNVLIN